MGHEHEHASADANRRWLAIALALLVAFMIGEVIAGLLAHSTALITDAGHMLTDVAALATAMVAIRIAARPPKGAYTYGFARVDALAGQANGITLLILAAWFIVQAVRHLIHPSDPAGGIMTVVALVGVFVNVLAVSAAAKADTGRLSVRGAVTHIMNDLWAFAATAIAGILILFTGWSRADPVASLIIATLMIVTGIGLVRASGRVFLEAAPQGVDPSTLGAELAHVDGVADVHDLHVWQLGPGESAMSAHVLVAPGSACHEIAATLRTVLAERYGLTHATLQIDHVDDSTASSSTTHICAEAHGPIHTAG